MLEVHFMFALQTNSLVVKYLRKPHESGVGADDFHYLYDILPFPDPLTLLGVVPVNSPRSWIKPKSQLMGLCHVISYISSGIDT